LTKIFGRIAGESMRQDFIAAEPGERDEVAAIEGQWTRIRRAQGGPQGLADRGVHKDGWFTGKSTRPSAAISRECRAARALAFGLPPFVPAVVVGHMILAIARKPG
jgi:hypothetical protein